VTPCSLVPIYQTMLCHILEDNNLHGHCIRSSNLTCKITYFLLLRLAVCVYFFVYVCKHACMSMCIYIKYTRLKNKLKLFILIQSRYIKDEAQMAETELMCWSSHTSGVVTCTMMIIWENLRIQRKTAIVPPFPY
jgi:hypothetical protein